MLVVEGFHHRVARLNHQGLGHVANHFGHKAPLGLGEFVPLQSPVQGLRHVDLKALELVKQGHVVAAQFLVVGIHRGLPLRQVMAAGLDFLDQRVEQLLALGQIRLVLLGDDAQRRIWRGRGGLGEIEKVGHARNFNKV